MSARRGLVLRAIVDGTGAMGAALVYDAGVEELCHLQVVADKRTTALETLQWHVGQAGEGV